MSITRSRQGGDGFLPTQLTGLVAQAVAGPVAGAVVAVDREALRTATRDAARSADHLREMLQADLDAAAEQHPGFVSSPAIRDLADSLRLRVRRSQEDMEDFRELLLKICTGYQAAEDTAARMLRAFLDGSGMTERDGGTG